jgi:hypothetical protein
MTLKVHASSFNLPGTNFSSIDYNMLYAGACWSNTKEGLKKATEAGTITVLDEDNKIVSNPGGSLPVYVNGKLLPVFQTKKKLSIRPTMYVLMKIKICMYANGMLSLLHLSN